jgi:hypothetical protein
MKNKIWALTTCTLLMLFTNYTIAQNILPVSGNVGIGTTTPESNLDVKGCSKMDTLIVRETFTTEKPVLMRDTVIMERTLKIEENIEVLGNANFHGSVKLLNYSNIDFNENLLRIAENGDIVPMPKLGLLEYIFSDGSGSSSCQIIGDDINGNAIYSLPIWKSISGVNQPNGIIYTGVDCPTKVGIGIANPSDQLHVVGSGRFTQGIGVGVAPVNNTRINVLANNNNGIGVAVNSSAPNSVGISINANSATASGIIVNSTNSSHTGAGMQINYHNNNAKAFVINDGSNDVFRVYGNGNVYATEVNVMLKSDFPDYVFNTSYNLMSFSELKTFILNNKHLPRFPTAENIANKGLKMGEITVLLVEKIEELTLYILLLEERIKTIEENK